MRVQFSFLLRIDTSKDVIDTKRVIVTESLDTEKEEGQRKKLA